MILIIVQQDHSNTHSLGNFLYYHFIDINHITMVEGIAFIQRRCMFNPLLYLNFICDLHFTLNLDSIKCDGLNYNIFILLFFIFSTKLHSLRLHWLNHKVNSQNSPLEYTSLYMRMKSSLTRTPCENNNWAHQYLQKSILDYSCLWLSTVDHCWHWFRLWLSCYDIAICFTHCDIGLCWSHFYVKLCSSHYDIK